MAGTDRFGEGAERSGLAEDGGSGGGGGQNDDDYRRRRLFFLRSLARSFLPSPSVRMSVRPSVGGGGTSTHLFVWARVGR